MAAPLRWLPLPSPTAFLSSPPSRHHHHHHRSEPPACYSRGFKAVRVAAAQLPTTSGSKLRQFAATARKAMAGVAAAGVLLLCSPLWAEEGGGRGGGTAAAAASELVVSGRTSNSVESILAHQLARRFREMSDEELAGVLEQLLRASKSFPLSVEDNRAADRNVELDQSLQEDTARGSTVNRTWSSSKSTQAEQPAESQASTGTKEKSGTSDDRPLGLQGKASSSISRNEKRKIAEDVTVAPVERKADGSEGRAESDDSRDLAALLWEELQKRSEASSGGAFQRSVETKMKSDIWDHMNFGPRGAFRDPKIVAAIVGGLVANGLLIVGGWSFLASRNADRLAKQDKDFRETGGNKYSETSQSNNPINGGDILDQGAALVRSIFRGSPNAGGQRQATSMDKRKKSLQPQALPGEGNTAKLDSAENKRTVGTSLSGSGSEDGQQQLSSRDGFSRSDISEGKSGSQAAVVSSSLRKRGGSQFADDIKVSNKATNTEPPTIRASNNYKPLAEMELDDDVDMFPRIIKSSRRNTDLEDAGYRYETGRLASPFVDAIIPGDHRSWSERSSPLTALKNGGKNIRAREPPASNIKPSVVETSAAATTMTEDNSYSSQQQGPSSIHQKKDEACMARNNSQDALMNPSQVADNRPLDDQVMTVSDNTVQYGELKMSDEKFASRIGSNQEAKNKTRRVGVDFWAKADEDVWNGWAHNVSRQVDMTTEGERDGNREALEMFRPPDWFNHKGSLWVRDLDGVYVRHPAETDSRVSQSSAEQRDVTETGCPPVRIPKGAKETGSTVGGLDGSEIADSKSTRKGSKSGGNNGSAAFDYRLLRLHQGDDGDRSKTPLRKAQGRIDDNNVVPFLEIITKRPSPIERTSPLYYGTREQGNQQKENDLKTTRKTT